MSRHTLYAYVDGSDLAAVAATLEDQLNAFVDSREWTAGDTWVVNQRRGREACTRPEDLEPWDLGLNVRLPDPGLEKPGWFADIESVARFLGGLHRELGRDFVIGIQDVQTGIAEDLFFISSPAPDLEELGRIMGVRD